MKKKSGRTAEKRVKSGSSGSDKKQMIVSIQLQGGKRVKKMLRKLLKSVSSHEIEAGNIFLSDGTGISIGQTEADPETSGGRSEEITRKSGEPVEAGSELRNGHTEAISEAETDQTVTEAVSEASSDQPKPEAASEVNPNQTETEAVKAIDQAKTEVRRKGRKRQGCEALLQDLRTHPQMAGRLRYNTFTYMAEAKLPQTEKWTPVTKSVRREIAAVTDMSGYTVQAQESAIMKVASEDPVNPVTEMLEGLPVWDGKDRYRLFLPQFLGAENTVLNAEITKYVLMSALTKAYGKDGRIEEIMVLVSNEEGIGKSSLVEALTMIPEYHATLKTLESKAAYEVSSSHWIIELTEMLAVRKARNPEEVKAFLSDQKTVHRTLYDEHAVDRQRRCIFIATADKPECLPADSSGNRRYLPVFCKKNRAVLHPLANSEETKRFVRQLWAQALEDFRAGRYDLSVEYRFRQELNLVRAKCEPHDPQIGQIQAYLDNCSQGRVCVAMIWKDCYERKGIVPEKQGRRISELLNSSQIEGWEPCDHLIDFGNPYGMQKGWVRTN